MLKFFRGFVHAGRGLAEILRSERNARVHAGVTIAVVAAGFGFHITAGEWIAVILASAMVWVAELVNTAIERLVDLASPDFHPLAGKAKDLAAAAVLFASLGALLIGGIVFLPKVLS